MQMIHPLHAGAARGLRAPVLVSIEDRAVESKVRARHQHIIRTALLLFGSAVVICILLMWRTDVQRRRAALAAFDAPVNALQARIEELGFLPATMEESKLHGLQYYSQAPDRYYAMHSGKPSIVGISDKVSLLIHPSGRFVVFYQRGRLHTEWMSSSQYEAAMKLQSEDIRAFEQSQRSRPPELP